MFMIDLLSVIYLHVKYYKSAKRYASLYHCTLLYKQQFPKIVYFQFSYNL